MTNNEGVNAMIDVPEGCWCPDDAPPLVRLVMQNIGKSMVRVAARGEPATLADIFKDQQKLNEHHSRLAFLRDVARRRLGESP